MLNVAASYWNKVYELGTVKTRLGMNLLPLGEEELTNNHQEMYDRLKARGYHPRSVLAFLDVALLLAEREAIAEASQKAPELRRVLPEVLTVSEAVILGTKERRLTRNQQEEVQALLTTLEEEGSI